MSTQVERIEAKIQKLQAQIPRCEHKQVVGRCPYCDKCKHGVNAYMHCAKCHANDDQSWRTAEVTDAEMNRIDGYFSTFYPPPDLRRRTPYGERNYHDYEVALIPLLLRDLRQARKRIAELSSDDHD